MVKGDTKFSYKRQIKLTERAYSDPELLVYQY